jgi:hypothetical protein
LLEIYTNQNTYLKWSGNTFNFSGNIYRPDHSQLCQTET